MGGADGMAWRTRTCPAGHRRSRRPEGLRVLWGMARASHRPHRGGSAPSFVQPARLKVWDAAAARSEVETITLPAWLRAVRGPKVRRLVHDILAARWFGGGRGDARGHLGTPSRRRRSRVRGGRGSGAGGAGARRAGSPGRSPALSANCPVMVRIEDGTVVRRAHRFRLDGRRIGGRSSTIRRIARRSAMWRRCRCTSWHYSAPPDFPCAASCWKCRTDHRLWWSVAKPRR